MGNEIAKEETRERARTLDPRKNLSVDVSLKYDKNPTVGMKSILQDMSKPPTSQRNRRQSLNILPFDDDSILNALDGQPQSRQMKIKNNNLNKHNEYFTLDNSQILSSNNIKKTPQQRDRILTSLSRKNEELRKELKLINEQLTEKIQRKKLIPKKKKEGQQTEENQLLKRENQAKSAALKRELQNGYKQIDTYKRTLQQLNAKEEVKITHTKVKQMENQVAQLDRIINETVKKIDGMKNIKKNQQKILQHDINQDLIQNVEMLKRQQEEIKQKMKQLKRREQQRQQNYKRQQAYLFEVQKKYRELSGQYFPQLKKKAGQSAIDSRKSSTIDKYSKKSSNEENYPQSYEVKAITQQLNELRAKHEQYHRKIDNQLQVKNKITDQMQQLDRQISTKQKTIETLKSKLAEMKKIMRPNKKALFGYDSYAGSEGLSSYQQSEVEIQQQQQNQDQFDIKHLIANIPKPIRLKPVEMQINNSIKSGQSGNRSSDGKGMVITNQKSQPKVWGNSLTRKQQKGKFYKNQLLFDDIVQFENSQLQPLIIGVNGWVNKNGDILALQAIYLNGEEIRYGVKSSVNADGFMIRYDLQAPDYLKNVIGGFGEAGTLEYIAFHSKKGKTGTFGNKRDYQESFTFGLSTMQRPFRFNGASLILESQPRICRIGIEICPE